MNKNFTLSTGIILLITFMFISIVVNAQETSPIVSNDQIENTQAMQFHIFGGVAASYCMPLVKQSQLRFTIDMALSSNTTDKDTKHTSSGTNSPYYHNVNSSQSNREYSVDFVASYIYRLTSKKDIRPFLGLGIVGAYGKSTYNNDTESNGTNSSPNHDENESNSSTMGIGLRGTLGCEAFITSRVSMLAEYQMSVLRNWTDSDYWSKATDEFYFDKDTTTSSSDGWQILLHSIRLGLAVHF